MAMLKRAERLFRKGNYPSAKKDFEEINKYLRDEEIAEKIKVCEREIRQLKTKDLIKRGRKNTRKGDLKEAIRCFEQAYDICGEDWIPKKIRELRTELSSRRSSEAAKDAEKAGDYEKAAVLYEKALVTQESEDLLLKKASSLVKAGKYDEAISIFKASELSDDGAVYDYGFALAKTGAYDQCLKIWEMIESLQDTFLKQRALVQSLLATTLFEEFFQIRYSPPTVYGKRFATIYEKGMYLLEGLKIKTRHSNPETLLIDLQGIVEYGRYASIDWLWKEERYEAIRKLLLPYPSEMDADLLALCAKTFFRLAEISGTYLPDLTMFWLTAVHTHEIVVKLSENDKDREAVRESLIQRAEDVIKGYAETGGPSSKGALRCWLVEKELIRDLSLLAGDQDTPQLESDSELMLVCTPHFARQFGLSDHVLRLIRENRDAFSDIEHYLRTGAYYSSAGQSLFHLHREEYEESLASLPQGGARPQSNPANGEAEFVKYGVERVNFAYGLHCLEKGEPRAARYFESAADLFKKSRRYEKEFTDKAITCHDLDQMEQYEDALADIHTKRPSEAIKDALSLTMVRRAIRLYNHRRLNIKAAEAVVAKALMINPDNDLARSTLERMKVDLDMEELIKAINKFKMNKACQVAAKSKHQEVKEEFFEFMERNIEHVDDMEIDEHEKVILLNDFFKWCARVDESHPILYDIDEMLKELE